MAGESVNKFTFGTVNCSGNKQALPLRYITDGPKIRYELLENVLTGTDALALQELRCKEIIREKLQKTHYIHMHNFTGIVLKKEVFDEPKFYSQEHFCKETTKVGLTGGELEFVVVKPKDIDCKLLIVSYHGPNISTDEKINTAISMIKLCFEIKSRVKAHEITIGGDFNLPIELFNDNVRPLIKTKIYARSKVTDEKRTKHNIDYFVYEEGISVADVTIKALPHSVTKEYELSNDEISTFLDHDPVVGCVRLCKKKRGDP